MIKLCQWACGAQRAIRQLARVDWLRPGGVIIGLLMWVATVGAVPARAQTPEPPGTLPGLQRHQVYLGEFPFEHINTLSSNVVATFDDLVLPGNGGRRLVLQRTLNTANATWGFGIAGYPHWMNSPDDWWLNTNSPPPGPEMYPAFFMPDGSVQRSFTTSSPNGSSHPTFVTSEFWRYHVADRRLEMPDGSQCWFNAKGQLTDIADTFGN